MAEIDIDEKLRELVVRSTAMRDPWITNLAAALLRARAALEMVRCLPSCSATFCKANRAALNDTELAEALG